MFKTFGLLLMAAIVLAASPAAAQDTGSTQGTDDPCKNTGKISEECVVKVCSSVIFSSEADPVYGCTVAAAIDPKMPRTPSAVAKKMINWTKKRTKKYNNRLFLLVKKQAWSTLDYWFASKSQFKAFFDIDLDDKADAAKVSAITEKVLKKPAQGLDLLGLGHDLVSQKDIEKMVKTAVAVATAKKTTKKAKKKAKKVAAKATSTSCPSGCKVSKVAKGIIKIPKK